MFATKHDFLPKQYIQQLAFVFENCEPMSILEVRDIIQNDLPSAMSDVFVNVEENPIACATIAQVHRASISGTAQSVALKVKNVKSQNVMKSDLANMLGNLKTEMEIAVNKENQMSAIPLEKDQK